MYRELSKACDLLKRIGWQFANRIHVTALKGGNGIVESRFTVKIDALNRKAVFAFGAAAIGGSRWVPG